MQADDFSIDAHSLILRVFDIASSALDDEWRKEAEAYKKRIPKAYEVDESEGDIMRQERDW